MKLIDKIYENSFSDILNLGFYIADFFFFLFIALMKKIHI